MQSFVSIVDTAFVSRLDDVVSGSYNIFGKRNACLIRCKESNRRRMINNRRRRLNKAVVKADHIDPFVTKNSYRKMLWHGSEHVEK